MSSKLVINKDINKRYKLKKIKNEYRIYKLLLNDTYIPTQNRQIMAYSHLYSSNDFMLKTSIKNRCVLTGRSRSVYAYVKLSRMIFKNLAVRGNLPGIVKYSW